MQNVFRAEFNMGVDGSKHPQFSEFYGPQIYFMFPKHKIIYILFVRRSKGRRLRLEGVEVLSRAKQIMARCEACARKDDI